MAKYNWGKLRQKLADGNYKNLKEFCDKNKVLYNGTARTKLAGIVSEKVKIKDTIEIKIKEKKAEIIETAIAEKKTEIIALVTDEIALKQRVLKERARLAFCDPRKFYNPDGSLKKIHELDADEAAVIANIETETKFIGKGDDVKPIVTNKIKQWDKTRNLDALDKYLGLYEKDNKQKSGDITIMSSVVINNQIFVPKVGKEVPNLEE